MRKLLLGRQSEGHKVERSEVVPDRSTSSISIGTTMGGNNSSKLLKKVQYAKALARAEKSSKSKSGLATRILDELEASKDRHTEGSPHAARETSGGDSRATKTMMNDEEWAAAAAARRARIQALMSGGGGGGGDSGADAGADAIIRVGSGASVLPPIAKW